MRSTISIEAVEQSFKKYSDLLQEAGVYADDVEAKELIEYFSESTPTGDTATLQDVVSNRWLFLHEIVELRHLKLKGHEISSSLVWDQYEEVVAAHIAATAIELKLASKHNDQEWVERRVQDIPTWLEDPDFPEQYRVYCEHLFEHYNTNASSQR